MISDSPSSVLLAMASVCCLSQVASFSPINPFSNALPTLPTSSLCVSLKQLDDTNMRDLLFRPSDGRSVLVDAYAPWCGPCKLIEPYLVGCAEKYSDRLSVIKYDVEGNNNNDLKVELLLQGVMVRGLPTLILYNGGEPVATHSGAITETDLEEWLDNNLLAKIDETETNAIQNDGPVEEKVGESSSITGQRGFVSFASQFDDYSL